MIVVTVGSSPGNYSFHRLVKAMDQVLERKGWQGWMQIGSSAYRPKAPHDLFVSQQEMEEKVRNCDLVVGHCGVGTLLLAREFRKNICVLPREPQFGEILDFHQIEMAQNLAGVSWVELLQEHSLEAQIAHRLGESGSAGPDDALVSPLAARLSHHLTSLFPTKGGGDA